MPIEQIVRKQVLNGKKSERIIFAVTPEMKDAVSRIAEEKCMSVSAYITSLLVEDIVVNRGLLKEVED